MEVYTNFRILPTPITENLIDKGYLVKDVNTAISHRQAKHRGAMYRKSDSDDAEAIALATLNMLDKLPDACPNDAIIQQVVIIAHFKVPPCCLHSLFSKIHISVSGIWYASVIHSL